MPLVNVATIDHKFFHELHLVPATLELGGKSANIILDDANLDLAVEGIQLGILIIENLHYILHLG
jgi:hypothetical protein